MDKKDYHSFTAQLNDFDGYDKAGKEKNGPIRSLDFYQHYYTPANCGVSAIYYEKFGRFVAKPKNTASIGSVYNSYSEELLTPMIERDAKYNAALERVPNVAAHPRCKETLEYVERDLDKEIPGIVEFMRRNFGTYRYITEAERTPDEQYDNAKFLKICDIPDSEQGIRLFRRNN